MVLVGGKKGAKSVFTLFLNFFVFLILVIFMTAPEANPIILTLIASIIITAINLYYINGTFRFCRYRERAARMGSRIYGGTNAEGHQPCGDVDQ